LNKEVADLYSIYTNAKQRQVVIKGFSFVLYYFKIFVILILIEKINNCMFFFFLLLLSKY
jgi:hypothetical protein